ncbi:FAD-binding oxidoreductase [Ornithinibacillus halophilus]|uniref:FAD/FMN-containing dehydrogenase n=1 Tax=Ornithinibacillus halophilus TaxID=930117 RepID=A0A1M5J498_9BACI|nr:FAD-binding oxidoreductase [Ornithinibacillus halophilus]SHG35362.1 FAD/FMN-containing dehydrogenase [Ornithinibacillus halophilus]
MNEKVRVEKSGTIILPNHDRYDEKRKVWNARIDRRPAVIFECKSEADVISAVNYARQGDLEISIRGGGHHIDGTAVCDGGVMIDLSNMKDVKVDENRKVAVVEGGATLADVDAETQKYGLATPTGTVSETGIAGLALGGGFGYLRGKYGLTCDNIVSARMVTADGKAITVNKDNYPDLYWAICGGGGNFGVVTSFEFQLYPVGPNVLGIDVMYDYRDLKQILHGLKEYMKSAIDEISVNLAIMQLPPAPFLPEALHNKRVVSLSGMYIGELNREIEENVIEPLVSFAEPIMDQTGILPYVELQKKLDAMIDVAPFDGTSLFFEDLPEDAISTLMNAIENADLPMTLVQIWALHGKMNRIPADEKAFSIRDAGYLLLVDAIVPEDNPQKCRDWVNQLHKDLLPHSLRESAYVNGARIDANITESTYGNNYELLAKIKGKYDPDNLFCHNHNIAPKE